MTAPTAIGSPVRHRIRVTGVVQGVGFRPFAFRLAHQLGLAGHVGNDGEGVFVEVEGNLGDVESFESRLLGEAPPLSRVLSVEATSMDLLGERAFRVVDSPPGSGAVTTFVSPDVAICQDCLAEMSDPHDRRYRYPFTNCTNCGPRFTITVALPYDRSNTTMSGFELCWACSAEYADPADRRFHAQPIACGRCGPRIWFEGTDDGQGRSEGTDNALEAAHTMLAQGGVLAIKGLGGYHLACDAASDRAVEELRRRKHRPHKPLAVMVPDASVTRELAFVDDDEQRLLENPARPIILLRRRPDAPISEFVAPSNPHLGVMLPYTPLHHLLFAQVPGSGALPPQRLVMTSGNLSEEPICYQDDDARVRLGRIADGWLLHDRPIHVPCDDSVVRLEGGRELPIRRSHGYAPLPVQLPFASPPLLAVGGELKNTFCISAGRNAWVSQHIGDMGSLETLQAFEHSARQFEELYAVSPQLLAADGHPGYRTQAWAQEHAPNGEEGVELVQHHHAHVAAVMAEHQVAPGDEVVGFAFDGTGYGTDGAVWGGEVLVAGYGDFERAAHLRYVPLPGGDAGVRNPYRLALAHLRAAGINWSPDLPPVVAAGEALDPLERQLARGVHCLPTSSMGRLFDAVSSLLGIRHVASYEAQAAIELEAAASMGDASLPCGRFEVTEEQIDAAPLLGALIDGLRGGSSIEDLAAGFHRAVAAMIGEVAERLCVATGIDRVALSGGVFQNVLLVSLATAELRRRSLTPLTHRIVPPNDGGLALGQAAVAGFRAAARRGPR